MGETANHEHPPPPQPTPTPPRPAVVLPPLGAPKGPPFPPAEQLLQLHYCIHSNPPWPQAVLLAFQHYIVMLGNIVVVASLLVPRMGGGPGDKAHVIQSQLFMAAINTLLQTWFGTRLPTVMGPSLAYILTVLAIINDLSDETFSSEHERFLHTMRTIQGSMIVSSFVNALLGYSQVWGKFIRLLSPLVITPVVCLVGLGLFGRGFPQLANCVEIGLPMLILLVISQQYLKNIHPITRPILEKFALLICVGFIWSFAAILTAAGAYNHAKSETQTSCRTDRSFLMSTALWIRIPYPLQWGTPIFRASHVFGMMGAAIVSSVESTATFYAASRLSGATPPPTFVITRSIGLQGFGQLLEGLVGTIVGSTASVENVGLLGLTHVGSRRVVQISTGFMFFFSIFGKFGAFFASIPIPIFAAIFCVLYAIVAATGVSYIQFINKNSMRNLYILGLSLFLGVSIPQYFTMRTDPAGHGPVRTGGGWFNDILNTIFSSPPTVALIVGVILDTTLEVKHSREDSGVAWWKPFQRIEGDNRNEEFYSYPLRIHEYLRSRFH